MKAFVFLLAAVMLLTGCASDGNQKTSKSFQESNGQHDQNLPSLNEHIRNQDELMRGHTDHYRRQNRNARLRRWEN